MRESAGRAPMRKESRLNRPRRRTRLLVAALIAIAAGIALRIVIGAGAAVFDLERNPVRTHPTAAVVPTGPQRFIVKLRPPATADKAAKAATLATAARLSGLAARTGLGLDHARRIAGRLQALELEPAVAGESMAESLARLRADPEVEYAEPDQMRYIHSVPNDPLFPSQGALTDPGQWFLMPSSTATPAAVDAQTAWNTTQGSASLVIADIDTGVRFDHPDLGSAANGGRLLAGYCFISNAFIANNPGCPGPDASDPGDWVTSADLSNASSSSICSGASVEPSSWHGTRTAGLLAALTNNGIGIAGMTWSGAILPVRALGTCGGEDSDIIKAMLWAAGIAVADPADPSGETTITNPNPAKIINMSIGGSGTCPASYTDAIDQITPRGILIVVSAGNESGPVDAPANCPGVVGVAGLRQAGTKVGYSSFGPEISVGAPAGNCYYTTGSEPCVYSITSTTNLGTTAPGANDYTGLYYCDASTGSNPNCQIASDGSQYRTYNIGTSFSAPLVSGIGALMAAANPNLNACQLRSRIKEGSLPYPQYSSALPAGDTVQPPACANGTDTAAECVCTLDGRTCGAGMANASGALTAALRPVAAVALPTAVSPGATLQLNAGGSAAAPTRSIASYAWSSVGGQSVTITNASSSTATVTAPSCGLATVQVVVTDNTGAADTAEVVLSPSSASTAAPSTAGSTNCSFTAPAVEIAVCPTGASAQANGGTENFVDTLGYTTDTAVTWAVNGIAGGNATVGTISSSGAYTAPASVPNPATVTVTATSVADATVVASTNLTVTSPPSHGGGGALDGLSLLVEGSVLLVLMRRRRHDAAATRP